MYWQNACALVKPLHQFPGWLSQIKAMRFHASVSKFPPKCVHVQILVTFCDNLPANWCTDNSPIAGTPTTPAILSHEGNSLRIFWVSVKAGLSLLVLTLQGLVPPFSHYFQDISVHNSSMLSQYNLKRKLPLRVSFCLLPTQYR